MNTFLSARVWRALPFLTLTAVAASCSHAAPADYFRIRVVDQDTGRGVPLVQLKTTSEIKYYTDSNGVVAVGDPEFLGQKVYFSVKSDGYEVPADGFGNRGQALDVRAGGNAEIKIKRTQIAQRLYRITGAGIYTDSVLTGVPIPIEKPTINGLVTGQDTVEAVPYQGKLFWLWGDTNRLAYPLGNFKTSSATSLLPGKGGLDPDKGINLDYFADKEGFSKQMIPIESSVPVWMGGLFTMNDNTGRERLFGSYAKAASDSNITESGLAVFNDDKQEFEIARVFDSTLRPGGDPRLVKEDGKNWLYFDPFQRTLADYAHIIDGRQYQAYTPLAPGTRFQGKQTKLERDANGNLVYGWKADTGKMDNRQANELVEAGLMKADESSLQFRDVESGAPIVAHGSTIAWNPYRGRWVQIFTQNGGTSVLGELWMAEADTPTGPWVYARKVLTHDKYTFYNPKQHPFFAKENGRQIYFEGTYTTTYSGNDNPTPRYNYNQMMYRLDLDDARLDLPVAVYQARDGKLALRGGMDLGNAASIPFFALPPTAKSQGLTPVWFAGGRLQTAALAGQKPLFYAARADDKSSAVVPLYQWSGGGKYAYSTDADAKFAGLTRAAEPVCRVWRNPSRALTIDAGAQAL